MGTASNFGLFSVDPGGSSGTAWGVFDCGGRKNTVMAAMDSKSFVNSDTITGDEITQARAIAKRWSGFLDMCVNSLMLPLGNVHLICEDWTLEPRFRSKGKDTTIPLRIIWALNGYRYGQADEFDRNGWGPIYQPDMIMQPVNLVKTYATDERLKMWGCWIRGKEHERDAWRHIAYRIAKLQQAAAAGSSTQAHS